MWKSGYPDIYILVYCVRFATQYSKWKTAPIEMRKCSACNDRR